jgi:hypothetical protein
MARLTVAFGAALILIGVVTCLLLTAALDRILPQLEAPAEPPQTVEEGPEDAQPHSDSEEVHEGVQQRPRWRRVFGR